MNNKNGTLYVWNRERLSAGPIVSIPLGDGIAAFVGSPGWSETLQMIYSAQSVIRDDGNRKVGNGVTAWHADPGCGFRPIWSRSLGDGSQATPLVVGNTVFATGGRPGSFYGLRAGTGDVLWTYPTEGRTVAAMISVGGRRVRRRHCGRAVRVRPGSNAARDRVAGAFPELTASGRTLGVVDTISFARGIPAPECIPVDELADCARAAIARRRRARPLVRVRRAATSRCANGSQSATASSPSASSSRTARCRGSSSSRSASPAVACLSSRRPTTGR